MKLEKDKKKKKMTSGKYLFTVIVSSIVLCGVVAGVLYLVDPWLYFRIEEPNQNWLDGAYVSPGLIKNSDYDTAVIGSSYFQDFRMSWFRDQCKMNPVNLTVPGLDLYETALLSRAVVKEGKATTQIICLTYYNFEGEIQDKNRIPQYLLDDSKTNDIQYFFSYEAWVKFMPLDIGSRLVNLVMPGKLEKYSSMMSPEALGNEINRFEFDEEKLMAGFQQQNRISDEEAVQRLAHMKQIFDSYQTLMEYDSDTEYRYVLPPHSSLYWYYLKEQNLLQTYYRFEEYVVEQLENYPNVSVLNTQSIPEIVDLNHYRDTTHYDLKVQEKIVAMLAENGHELTKKTLQQKQEEMNQRIREFEEKYLNGQQ